MRVCIIIIIIIIIVIVLIIMNSVNANRIIILENIIFMRMIIITVLVWGDNIICMLGDAASGIVIGCAVVVVIFRCFDGVSVHVFVLFINGVYAHIFRDSVVVVFSGRWPSFYYVVVCLLQFKGVKTIPLVD